MSQQAGGQAFEGFIKGETELSSFLSSPEHAGEPVRTNLEASERVIARVTDGIYREPASAFRELISNAWDADAKSVTILTDAPRFERIHVRDDGNGMSYQTLAYLIKNIGGSSKRSGRGKELGVTASTDTDRSPGGRLLIGKIGIGLFSVSQLARRFRIITKVKGEPYRLIAEVSLRAYAETDDEFQQVERESDDKYISGVVEIVRQEAEDLDSHGTDLILEELKPRVRDLLSDRDRWGWVKQKEDAELKGDRQTASSIRVSRPLYHAGFADPKTKSLLTEPPRLPWDANTPPADRMSKLMDAVASEEVHKDRPDLATYLDAYLGMLWTLGLSAPVAYVDQHPFELKASDTLGLYWLSNEQRGQAVEVKMQCDETVRAALERAAPGGPQLEDGLEACKGQFRVFIDDVEIKRPIRFRFVPTGPAGLGKSLLFVGKYRPDLSGVAKDRRGGGLDVEGYIFWNGRIIPKENNGVLVRIRGASGAAFDRTFFNYEVSEQTRLRQLTSELFVRRGLDAALNIDRESFNFSHPHVQLVALWLQRGIRQLTNKHKEIAARKRLERSQSAQILNRSQLETFADEIWRSRQGDVVPPTVILASKEVVDEARRGGSVALRADSIFNTAQLARIDISERETKAQALMQVLLAFDLIQEMTFEERESLVRAIFQVFYGVEA